jgi:hypothetical protein
MSESNPMLIKAFKEEQTDETLTPFKNPKYANVKSRLYDPKPQ